MSPRLKTGCCEPLGGKKTHMHTPPSMAGQGCNPRASTWKNRGYPSASPAASHPEEPQGAELNVKGKRVDKEGGYKYLRREEKQAQCLGPHGPGELVASQSLYV